MASAAGALSLIALMLASGCGGSPSNEKPQLIENGLVCGMASPAAVKAVLGTGDYTLAHGTMHKTTGLTTAKQRMNRADTCRLASKVGGTFIASIEVSQHEDNADALAALRADLTSQAQDQPKSAHCHLQKIPGFGRSTLCNGTNGVQVNAVGPTLLTFIYLPTHKPQPATRMRAVLALARNVSATVGKQGDE